MLGASKDNFYVFFRFIFSESLRRCGENYVDGSHIRKWCDEYQKHKRTSRKSARKHLKSTILHAWVMWRLWRQQYEDTRVPYLEGLYLSYKEDLAEYHLKNINRYIEFNPYFRCFVKLTTADTIVRYAAGQGESRAEMVVEPAGIMSFKRGRHPHFAICDDILADPEKKLDMSQIEKITRIFQEEVESLPKEGGELHLSGTPQDESDLFAVLEENKTFYSCTYTAEIDSNRKIALWPELFPFERLQQIRKSIGEKSYQKEYMCRPVRGMDSYMASDVYDKMVRNRLKNYDVYAMEKIKLHEYTFAGFDLGKKTHPSHLFIVGIDRKKRLVQVHSKFMDGWDYTDQLEYLKLAIEKFNISRLFYDNTRAEFEGFAERGELPAEMEGIVFTAKNKFAMAAEMDKQISNNSILLINDPRQRRQILSVDNDLKAPETAEGHGDAFFSMCLAVEAARTGQAIMIWSV